MTVTIDASNAKTRATGKIILSNYAQENGKVNKEKYESKIISFKLDEDPLQHRIYFPSFVESLEMIFSQYKETCEVLLDNPKIGGYNIKEFAKRPLGIFYIPALMCIAED